MFGNVIYYDKNKILDYTTIITGKQAVESEITRKSINKDATINLNPVSLGASSEMEYKITSKESFLHSINEFEKKLSGRDDFFDFTIKDDFCLDTINRGNIVKFNSFIYVPEEFDMIQMIEKFKPMIVNQAVSGMQSDEVAILKEFLNTQNAKIPTMCNVDEHEVRALLETNHLIIPYEELEEYEEVEMTFIARTLDNALVNKEKPFFEPLKHFIKMNRAMRRTMVSDTPNELNPIYSEMDYRMFEIIAIYG